MPEKVRVKWSCVDAIVHSPPARGFFKEFAGMGMLTRVGARSMWLRDDLGMLRGSVTDSRPFRLRSPRNGIQHSISGIRHHAGKREELTMSVIGNTVIIPADWHRHQLALINFVSVHHRYRYSTRSSGVQNGGSYLDAVRQTV